MGSGKRVNEPDGEQAAHERKYFSQAEAAALVGKRVRSLVDFSGVPRGTTGLVVRADPAGRSKSPFGKPVEVFSVAIQWDLPERRPFAAVGIADGEPFVFVNTGKPLVDWFSKDEYDRYLVEESEPGTSEA
jgi:hypothetical protein